MLSQSIRLLLRFRSLKKNKLQNMLARHHYSCDYCGTVFKYESKLDTHYRPYNCKKCSKAFSKQENLRDQLTSHKILQDVHKILQDVLSRGSSVYLCIQRGKIFRIKTKLNIHDIIHHSNFKPYNCNLCGKFCE